MEAIIDFIRNYDYVIVIGILILMVILIILQILNSMELSRIEKRYKRLMKGSTGKNLEDMIIEYKKNVDDSLEVFKNIENMYKSIDERLQKSIQKFAVVRYRAFDDVGSDLSFSIAMLNENNDGFVITGIYGRNESTTFAKPIEKGLSKYDLSDEEKLAIKIATNNRTIEK
ncbi:DUF4446 family protein [Fonticella tunisiensis]|uniref:Uncharacterized protein DUF4446 n=1 Tax=Fonticella tunisiensis TaxID=1096341 RepID=A0A4R7KCR9_9CLOT|nr:DUF4446 family protein [Fonticella tunisiensis]TDT50486.1 uncharacterized protein DUF4446 [Fonticella tunisiensis]